MVVGDSTVISNVVLFYRTLLLSKLTDPQSGKRPSDLKYVMSSYPNRTAWYPVITVKNNGFSGIRAGQNTEEMWMTITTEIRVWARDVRSRDTIADSIIDTLREAQQDTSGIIEEGLHDLEISSVVPVDEEGEHGLHSAVITITNTYVTGQ